jgi:hypothetical protein
MGGFSNAFVDLAKSGIEKVGSAIGKSSEAKDLAAKVENGFYHAVFKPEAAFKDIPAANKLWDAYSGPYHQLTDKYVAEGTQAAKVAGSIRPAGEIYNEAKKKASSEVFGPNREVIQGVLKHVEKTVSKNRADILADHLNVLFQEAPIKAGINKGKSTFDIDMARGGAEGGFETPASKYRSSNTFENIASMHQRTLAYKAAVPHLASNLNILMSDGFQIYAKTLATVFGPGRKAAEAQLLATNAISEPVYNGYREELAFRNGLIHKFAPGGVGEFIHRNMFIPGMSFVRYNTVLMSAIASKMAGDEAVQNLMTGDLKKALPVLNEFKLDPAKIKAQGGQLLPEDIDKIYHHGTDVRAFLNQGDKRTILGQQSPMFRTMGAFHKYVSNQSAFFKNVFKRQYQQGDFVGIARNVGLMSMAFPVMGAMIYESERLLSGNDWDDPEGHLKSRIKSTPAGYVYDKLTGEQDSTSAAHMAHSTIENLSHIASFGVATGYIRGASRAKLGEQILGPDASMAIQGVQDALKAASRDSKHPAAAKPFERDMLSDIPSYGIGSILSHELIPSVKKTTKYHAYRRAKVTEESDNPFSDSFDKNQ